MELILVHKWMVLLGLEVLAWSSTFFMLYARYKLRSAPLFKAGVFLTICTGVIPQCLLGIYNFYTYRTLDYFTLVILLLIIYFSTLGKKHVQKLDIYMHKKYSEK